MIWMIRNRIIQRNIAWIGRGRSPESLLDLASSWSFAACNSCRSSKAFRICSWHSPQETMQIMQKSSEIPKAPVWMVCQAVLKLTVIWYDLGIQIPRRQLPHFGDASSCMARSLFKSRHVRLQRIGCTQNSGGQKTQSSNDQNSSNDFNLNPWKPFQTIPNHSKLTDLVDFALFIPFPCCTPQLQRPQMSELLGLPAKLWLPAGPDSKNWELVVLTTSNSSTKHVPVGTKVLLTTRMLRSIHISYVVVEWPQPCALSPSFSCEESCTRALNFATYPWS